MRRIVVVAILVMGLVSLGMAFAFQNEPEGFRGLKWGDPPGEDMVYHSNLDWYTKKNDELKIGGAKFKNIYYTFHKEKFMRVLINTDNYRPLKDVVDLKFGDPTNYKDFGLGFSTYEWSGDIATIKLTISSKGAVLVIYSTKIYNQHKKDLSLEIEQEARRKEEERQKAAEKGLADFDYIPETKEEENKESREALEKPEIEYLGPAKSKEEGAPLGTGEGRGRAIGGLLGEGGRKIERQVEPPYPEWAQREGKTGVVRVKCWVLPSGDVRNVEVYQSSGLPRLDEHVCQYLMMWKFEPIEGQEIQWGIVPFHFELPEK